MNNVAVAWSSSDNNAIRYVLCIVFVDDVVFVHNRPGKGDAVARVLKVTRQAAEPRRSVMSYMIAFLF